MKIHGRPCKGGEQPCQREHQYLCAVCGDEFVTDVDTFHVGTNGTTLPNGYWPTCSLDCYLMKYGNTDPNGYLDINELDQPIPFEINETANMEEPI